MAENLKWPKEHRTLLLQSVVIGKAREIYIQLTIEQISNYYTVKELIIRHTSLYLKPTDKNVGTVEKKMTKLTLNLLEQKSNYLTDGALFKINSDYPKLRQLK